MDSREKLLSDQKLLKNAQYQDQIREVIERLGADPDEVLAIDTDKNIKILMNAEALVDKIIGSEIWEKEENGQYKIYAKMTAITLMTASLGMMEDYGLTMKEPTPYYAGISAWLGVPIPTLRSWWKNATTIMREQGALGLAAVQRSILKNIEISEVYLDALILDKSELEAMKKTPQGLIALLKVSTQTMYNAKMLTASGEAITGHKVDEKDDTKSGVSVVMPELIKIEEVKDDESDVTDKGS